MNHGHESHGHDSHASAASLFPAKEWQEFHQSDIQAGKSIVVVMSSIFVLGVIIYSIVLVTL